MVSMSQPSQNRQIQGNNAFMLPNNIQVQNGNIQGGQLPSFMGPNNPGQYNNPIVYPSCNQMQNNIQPYNVIRINRKHPGLFVNLHVHSEGSIQDALKIDYEYVRNFIDIGFALTDHGNLFAMIDFYYNMKKIGKTPIFGVEAYVGNFLSSKTRKSYGHKKKYYHLVLLVKNIAGILDLYKMVSNSELTKKTHEDKPIMSYDDITAYSKNFVCLSACIGGELPQYILHGQINEARSFAMEFKNIFRDDFYIEIQRHGLKEEEIINPELVTISRQLGIGLVATSDAHYTRPEDKITHDALQAKRFNKTLKDEKKPGFGGGGHHLLTPQEAEMLFYDLPDALDNTIEIFNKCKSVADDFETLFPKSIKDYHFPKFPTPNNCSEVELFKALCIEGFNKRFYNQPHKLNNPMFFERLQLEIETILELNFPGYFLIVSDITSFCRANNILVGPGRGSVAGSLVAYCMGITDIIEPISLDLLFERFLNKARQSAPDIDLDFDSERREEIIEYLKHKYGEEHVAQIITFGTRGAKAAIRDATNVLGESYAFGQGISKLIPKTPGISLKEAFSKSPELSNRYNSEPKVKEILDLAFNFEGLISNVSKHAAGVVISDKPLTNYLPTAMVKESDDKKKKASEQKLVKVTQFTMTRVEELGLLKIDILGLGTLTHIKYTLESINKRRISQGLPPLTMQNIPLNDIETYKMLGRGDTAGVFQVAAMSTLMRQLFSNINEHSNGDQCFNDIVDGISLNRPGPMDKIPQYISNRANPNAIMYDHPNLVPILRPSYGCLIYQEQVSLIAQKLAGFSPEKSDLFRRAVSKKKLEIIEQERQPFIYGQRDPHTGAVLAQGTLANGVSLETSNKIFNEFVDFCKYAFNKSHGAAYAVLTVITAYLKCHYPLEFMAALLSRAAVSGDNEKLPAALAMCQPMNIEILPPDINKSQALFSIEGERSIRFGLAGIKQLGIASVNKIIEERNCEGEFNSYQSLVNRLLAVGAVNKKVLEGLIYSGSLDTFSLTRKAKIQAIDKVLTEAKQGHNYMSTLFDDLMGADCSQLPDCKEFDKIEKLSLERDFLGTFVSENPLVQYDYLINNLNIDNIKDFYSQESDDSDFNNHNKKSYADGDYVKIIGYVTDVEKKVSRNKKEFLSFEIIDKTGTVRGTAGIEYINQIKKGAIIYLNAQLEYSERYGTQIKWARVGKIITKENNNINASELQIKNNTVVACQIKNLNEMQKFVGISRASNLPPHVRLYFTCLTTKKHFEFNEKVAIQDQRVLDFLQSNCESLIIR